ncbi:SRPBCC family protein [Nocardia sp. alder85J]|uniref:SRPBCC family protein n=1 Tax=Nocardia sp. alder85J TaxID=2862949 RepID=UPI001CD39E94|nr:SRPBCC family protein [Nocardia sp. alder85J]MCX4098552.1 SRPBCC family protein [Nocardia sp. alder85J]
MTEVSETRIEASREIAAPPEKVFEVLCDPRGHVTIDSSGMLQSADGEPAEKAGDTFVVHMDRESLGDMPLGKYDVTVTITEFDRDTHIEWTVGAQTIQLDHRYGYRLTPSATGTLVTSYCDWSRTPEKYLSALTFPVVPQFALRATLGILARTVE